MEKMKIEALWYAMNKKVRALFENDPEVQVGDIFQPDASARADVAFSIVVKNRRKLNAMKEMIPEFMEFGNVTLRVFVLDAEGELTGETPAELLSAIFEGNTIVKDIKTCSDFAGSEHTFLRFWPEVIQFFHDDISDYNGNWSGLAQDIAREVFVGNPFVHFCTASVRENESANDVPLGEWP